MATVPPTLADWPRGMHGMFEALETGKQLNDKRFDKLQLPLRKHLLDAQFELAPARRSAVIVIGGLDGAGKGALVHRLHEWMDARGIETNTFWEPSDEQESRPFFWRFWRALPARGRIGIFLGSWYTHPVRGAVLGDIGPHELARHCEEINLFERMLAEEDSLVIKLWLHVSAGAQRRQLAKREGKQQNPRTTDAPYELTGDYQRAVGVAERMILETDTSDSPWHLIEADNPHYRDIAAGEVILNRLLATPGDAVEASGEERAAQPRRVAAKGQPTVLDTLDLSLSLDRTVYREQLTHYQTRLQDLAWAAYGAQRSMIVVFEGWDAAGKGSAIRRVTRAIDPRLFHLTQTGAPSDEERAHHYLWRFWRHLQRDGRVTLFDRSWYGRVLVERIEGLARDAQWQRAYGEINQFEQQLVKHGCILLKFWLHISAEEQLRRFREREQKPHKQYKITEEDWRNRERWADYEQAVDQMVTRTSTPHAAWTLVAGNDKKYARIQILKACCDALQGALDI